MHRNKDDNFVLENQDKALATTVSTAFRQDETILSMASENTEA